MDQDRCRRATGKTKTAITKLIFLLILSCGKLQVLEASESRLAIVETLLKRYQRPFTLLDITANQSDIDAKAYPFSTFVILNQTPISTTSDNLIWLNRFLIAEDIHALSTCEHFDVILASDVLTRFPSQWEMVLSALRKMSHIVLCEVPSSDNKNNLLFQELHEKLASLAQETKTDETGLFYYILENQGPFPLERSTLIHPRKTTIDAIKFFEVHCDYHNKSFKKTVFDSFEATTPSHETITQWVQGINLMTYLIFNGTIPSRQLLLKHLPIDFKHTDWMPHNMIVQGSHLELIDRDDPYNNPLTGCPHWCQSELSKIKKIILTSSNKTPQEVCDIFTDLYGFKGRMNLSTY